MSILTDRQIRDLCVNGSKRIVLGNNSWVASAREVAALREQPGPQAFNIEELTLEQINAFKPMIDPFCPQQVREVNDKYPSSTGEDDHPRKIVSYGLSSMGYDVKLARDFKIFTNVHTQIIDPLAMNDRIYHDVKDVDYCIIPPNSYILGHTEEWFNIPDDILVVCLGKSTYARCGAIVNATPIEPGFQGRVVIEISNATNLPLKVYAGMGVAQFLFFKASEPCEVSYAKRGGKYQGQNGLQTAIV